MKYQEIFAEFTKKFKHHPSKSRGIGVEMELPVISANGEAVSVEVVQEMFTYLLSKGFELEWDEFSNCIVGASRVNQTSSRHFDHSLDTVMTDAGSGTIELVLAPQLDLYAIQNSFSELMALVVAFFDQHQCKVLGYGIQPRTAPSRKLLMPKERYFFFEKFSSNNVIPKSEGADAHLLTITASNQCHIDVGQEEAIDAVNVLNALSGLQVILNANSPIWKGGVDPNFKANREVFWEHCYPDRLNQVGIPPKFRDVDEYIHCLLDFKPMLVQRRQLLQVLNKATFRDFMFDKTPTIGQTLWGEQSVVEPKVEDIHHLNAFCYFNARLVPKLGTVESRMCCQQPPEAPLAPTALTLGLLSNLEEAKVLAEKHPWKFWEQLRLDALKHGLKTLENGTSSTALLTEFLDCARRGLVERKLGEEVFLEPLYERLRCQKSPAGEAIETFEQEGFEGFVKRFAFTNESMPQPELQLAAASY